jgi:DNA invertase Pin-like site-specific DNA recombinase
MSEKQDIVCVSYSRVSTLLGQDPMNQLIPIRNLAKARELNIIEDYIDVGVSGSKDRRPGLDKMIADAKNKKFQQIIIFSLDRLGRNSRNMLNLINDLNKYGVTIISIRENLDFASPIGQATITILSAIAQLELALISERIKTALASKKQYAKENNLDWSCGRPKVLNDEIENQIITLRAKGLSLRSIARLTKVSKGSVERTIKKRCLINPI